MQLSHINNAIAGLCKDVEDAIEAKVWTKMTERELVHELVLCILGSGVRYELAISYAVAITENRCLSKQVVKYPDQIEKRVSSILQGEVDNYWSSKPYKRYRYPNLRATYITRSYCNIINIHGSFKLFLKNGKTASALRRELINICPGIGPKQASHFLKNVGYTDSLAIIDTHILKYMEMSETICTKNLHLEKIDKYEYAESIYINTVKRFNYPVSVVDQAMWFVMRALGKEVMI